MATKKDIVAMKLSKTASTIKGFNASSIKQSKRITPMGSKVEGFNKSSINQSKKTTPMARRGN